MVLCKFSIYQIFQSKFNLKIKSWYDEWIIIIIAVNLNYWNELNSRFEEFKEKQNEGKWVESIIYCEYEINNIW